MRAENILKASMLLRTNVLLYLQDYILFLFMIFCVLNVHEYFIRLNLREISSWTQVAIASSVK